MYQGLKKTTDGSGGDSGVDGRGAGGDDDVAECCSDSGDAGGGQAPAGKFAQVSDSQK